MAKIAVIGPGAVGSCVIAWLMQNPSHSLVVAARSPLTDIEVQTPDRVLRVDPQVINQAEPVSSVDWVLVATKAYDAARAAAWLPSLSNSATILAVLQNGVEHVERFAPYFPRDRILPVMVDIPAERPVPGRVLQRRNGCMIVAEGEEGARFAELFAHTPIDVTQSNDFKSVVWRKLCVNAAGALSAVLMKPAVIARHDGIARIMESIIRECIAVGRAEGATLDDSIVSNVIEGYKRTPDAINSIHADRMAGRQMEIDARNGVIVRLGRKHGIPTPVNEMVVAMLEASA